MDSEGPPEIDLPETSILTESDYEYMYEVASDEQCYRVLELLGTNGELSREDIAREVTGGSECVDRLVDAGLVQRRIGPDDEGERWTYFVLSSLGEVLVEKGVREGVELLSSREHEYADVYSG